MARKKEGKKNKGTKQARPKATAKGKQKGKVEKVVRRRKAKNVKLNPIIDWVVTTVLSKKLLLQYIANVLEESAKEREEAAGLRREQKIIMAFWQITRNALRVAKAKSRNAESRLESMIEHNGIELDAFKHKVKHVFYDHKDDFVDMKVLELTVVDATGTQLQHRRGELRSDIAWLRQQRKDFTVHASNYLKDIRLKHAADISELRKDLVFQLMEMDRMFDKK
ncbi:putative positive regulation of protein localization to cilium [Trypoxylus dichotomus]